MSDAYEKARRLVHAMRALPPILLSQDEHPYDAPNERAIRAAERVLDACHAAGCDPQFVCDYIDEGVFLAWWAPGKSAHIGTYNVRSEGGDSDGYIMLSVDCYKEKSSFIGFDYTDEGFQMAATRMAAFLAQSIPEEILQPYLARIATGVSICEARGDYDNDPSRRVAPLTTKKAPVEGASITEQSMGVETDAITAKR